MIRKMFSSDSCQAMSALWATRVGMGVRAQTSGAGQDAGEPGLHAQPYLPAGPKSKICAAGRGG